MPESRSVTISYTSYLLRLRWQQQADEWVCQIMLISVTTGEQHYFNQLESMVVYLQQQRHVAKGGASLQSLEIIDPTLTALDDNL